MRERIYNVRLRVFQLHQLGLEFLGRLPTGHRRHANRLRYLQLDVVFVVELPGKLYVVNAHRMIQDGTLGQPAALPHTRARTKKNIQAHSQDSHGSRQLQIVFPIPHNSNKDNDPPGENQ